MAVFGSSKENARGPPLTHFPGRGPGRSLYLNQSFRLSNQTNSNVKVFERVAETIETTDTRH